MVGAILALALPAGATHTNQTDANDTSGRLDVQAVEFEHDSKPMRWRIVTFAGWTVHELWDEGYLVVELDTKGDEAIDFLAVVRSDGRHLVASLLAVRSDGTQKEIGELPAGKDGRRAAEVLVALRKLTIGPNRTSYHWSVLSSFTGSACPRTCLDRVPDEGMVEQLLPGVTPTPTPSPSPTPSPTA
jgi:hypothetical protein